MNIVETILAAQDGHFTSHMAAQLGISAKDAETGIKTLIPLIAGKISDKAKNSSADFDQLLEIVDDEEQLNYLNVASWSFSPEAMEDGKDILEHLFGSFEQAQSSLPQISDVKDQSRLNALAATYCVAAMANRNQKMGLSAQSTSEGESSSWISIIIAALLKGLMQALNQRRRRPRRRSRRSTYGRRRKKRTSTRRSRKRTRRRRRKKQPSLDDLIGDLIRG